MTLRNIAIKIKEGLDAAEAEKKKVEEEKRKQKETEERRKTMQTFEELCSELLPAMEKYAEPAKIKEEAENKKKKKGLVEKVFDEIIENPAPQKKADKDLAPIFDKLNDDHAKHEKEKLDTFAKFVVIGKFFFKERAERGKNNAKKNDLITIKLDEYKKEVREMRKNPVFKEFAKETMENPAFSEEVLKYYKEGQKSDVEGEYNQKLRGVLSYCVKLNKDYEKKLDFVKERPLSAYYSDMKKSINAYLNLGDPENRDKKLRQLVFNGMVLREIEKEVGVNGNTSHKEVDAHLKKFLNKPDIDLTIEKTMQSMKTLTIDSKLRRASTRPDFPQFFSEVVENAFDKAVESVKKIKAQKNVKAYGAIDVNDIFRQEGLNAPDDVQPVEDIKVEKEKKTNTMKRK